MFVYAALLSLALVPLCASQGNDAAVQVAAIKAHFEQSGISADVPALQSFNPTAALTLNFLGVGPISPGQNLSVEQVGVSPQVSVVPADPSNSLNGTFTLVMIDADIVGLKEANNTRHWLLNNETVQGTTVSNATSVAITRYAGPNPAQGSGPHRYVVLLYVQPSNFSAPPYLQPDAGVASFDLLQYLKDSSMGQVVGGNYFVVEQGVATVSVPATSSVVSTTLVPASSQASGSSAKTTSTSASTSTTSPTGSNSNDALNLVGSPLSIILAGLMFLFGMF